MIVITRSLFYSIFLFSSVVLGLVLSLPLSVHAIDMKVDRVIVNAPITGSTVTWSSVTFQESFGSVPVVITLPTNTNGDPATVRIRNVTTTGFDVGVVEPTGADGQTGAMTVDYFAAETGVYVFPGGVRMVVGAYSTSTHQGRNVSGAGWDDVNFATSFGSTPAVVAAVQTINSQPSIEAGIIGSPFLAVTIDNVTTTDMDMALERGETSTGTTVAETIGYIAMESGEDATLNGETISATLTANNIQGWDNGCYSNSFSYTSFSANPIAVASQNTRDGADGGWLRRCALSATSIGLTVDEDQAADSERAHTTESAGVFAISAAVHGSRNGRDIEAGSVDIAGTIQPTDWTSVSFPTPFNSIPYIFALPTTDGVPPAAIRVRNRSVTGFELAVFEPSGNDGSHSQMEVDYIAIIPGRHELPNGDIFLVDSLSTDNYLARSGSRGSDTVAFNETFSGGAAALLQIQSNNNEPALNPNTVSSPWLVTAMTNINATQMTIALERAEDTSGSVDTVETIAYFIARDGTNNVLEATDGGDVDYEIFLTPDNIAGIDDGCYNNSYTDSYTSPYVVSTQNSRDGNNGGWVRRCNLETGRIGLTIDEDQAGDTERNHTTEEASVFVFSRAFEAEFTSVDHYAIFHSETGVTCEAETITIAAHSAADGGVVAEGRTITITATSTTPGWSASDASWTLASGSGVFSAAAAGEAQYTFGADELSADFFLSNTSEAVIDIDVVDTDTSLTDQDGIAEDPALSFSASGFRFYNDANGDGDADGSDPIASPLTAGITSGQLILAAINTNGSSGACEARLSNTTQDVEFAYECTNPIYCYRSGDMLINSTTISANDAGNIVDFQAVSLTFDADGEAPFTMEYFDAGIVRLHAELYVPPGGGVAPTTLTGTSGYTTVRPADLTITTIEDADGTLNPGTTTSGAGFVASDTVFTVIVEARNADGGTTPNFGAEDIAEGIALATVNLVMPSTGDLPALSSADTFSPTGNEGEFVNNAVRWSEAGTITLRAQIADADFLGTGDVLGSTTGNVGRFYPDRLRMVSSVLNNGCSGGFTYMSDLAFSYTPMDISYEVEAITAGLVRLENYDDTYPTADLVIDAENNDAGTNLSSRLFLPSGSWVDGQYLVSGTDNGGFSRLDDGGNEAVDGPYSSLRLGIRTAGGQVDSTDFLSSDFTMNASTSGDCTLSASCTAIAFSSGIDARFGRLAISNTHGPETADLAVPFEIQYFDASNNFVTNTADNCTILPMTAINFDGNTLAVDSNRNVSVGTGTSTGTFNSFSPGVNVALSSGDAGLSFSAPGAGNSGAFNVDVDLTNLPWLRSDWGGDGDAANDISLPSAEIQFGRYRGHDRVIYWHEVLDE